MHVLVYKYIYRNPYRTGDEDKGPFKTYLKYSISLPSIKKFAKNNNLELVYINTSDVVKELKYKNKWGYFIYYPIKTIFKILSFGWLGDSELTVILSKNLIIQRLASFLKYPKHICLFKTIDFIFAGRFGNDRFSRFIKYTIDNRTDASTSASMPPVTRASMFTLICEG